MLRLTAPSLLARSVLALMFSVSSTTMFAADPAPEKKPTTPRQPTRVATEDDNVKSAPKPTTPDASKPDAKKPDPKKPTTAAKPEVKKPDAKKPATVAKPPAPKAFTPGGKYVHGDMKRPRPAVIAPPTESSPQRAGAPPSDAIVLFDGTDFAHWVREGRRTDATKENDLVPKWEIKNGYMQCLPRSGSIATKDAFGDCQLHIEWATPSVVSGHSQGRGNSGIMLHGVGEVQVLDSYDNDTYPDGQAAAIYHNYPPMVNASRRPGEWQSYDIILELAKIDATTKQVTRPARITVLHNGVVVHHAAELTSRASTFRFALQDHGNTVRYRNIWLRPLKGYDAQ